MYVCMLHGTKVFKTKSQTRTDRQTDGQTDGEPKGAVCVFCALSGTQHDGILDSS